MEKYIPYEKLSKKAKRAVDNSRRSRWAIDPRTRKPKRSNAYDRNANKALSRRESACSYVQNNTFYRVEEPVGYFYGS